MTKRKTALPQYLTMNQAGTYVFQARIPKHICQNNPTIKPTIWRSLGTKDRGEALRLSRRIWLMFDELSNKFNDSEVFGKAMELLREYDTKAVGDYLTKVEPFLVSLGDEDSELLERVLDYRSEIQKQRNVDASAVTAEEIRKLIREEVAQGKSSEPDFSADNYLLSEMVDKYMANQIDEGLASGSRKPYQSKLTLFKSILDALNDDNHVRLSDIDEPLLRSYSEVINKFPQDYKKQKAFKGKTIKDVVQYVKSRSRSELESEGIVILQGTKEILRLSRSLLTFIEKKKYPLRPGLNSIIEDGSGKKKKSNKIKLNAAYSIDELRAIFECDKFRNAKFKNAVDYWAPLIAIHTGATLAEICQLYVTDISNVDGIDVISINDDGDFKRLKNEDGRPRQVPIHPNLIKLNFLSFVEARRKGNSQRLFPEAERNGEDKYDSTGKRFATLRKSCSVIGAPREKTFHSFRTTVSLELIRRLGAPEGLANDIIGHASEYRESETKKTYGEGVTMPQVTYPWVKKLNFGINFNYPKKWRE